MGIGVGPSSCALRQCWACGLECKHAPQYEGDGLQCAWVHSGASWWLVSRLYLLGRRPRQIFSRPVIVRCRAKQVPWLGKVRSVRKKDIEAANRIFHTWEDLEETTYPGDLKHRRRLRGQRGQLQFAVAPHDCG